MLEYDTCPICRKDFEDCKHSLIDTIEHKKTKQKRVKIEKVMRKYKEQSTISPTELEEILKQILL